MELEFKWSKITTTPNLLLCPVVNCAMCAEGIEQFNSYIEWCETNIGKQSRIVFTKSGGIKKDGIRSRYGFRHTNATVELVIYYQCRGCRVCLRNFTPSDNTKQIYGHQAFTRFEHIMTKFGINIEDWAQNDEVKAWETKLSIPRVRISMQPLILNKTLTNVHHLDWNSSYLSGMKEYEPKWGPALDWMYEHRKDDPVMKSVMVMTTGWFQSKLCKAKWSHFSKAGIEYNNRKIGELAEQLVSTGRKIIGFNTDGIWYQGEVFHNVDEGIGLGHWKNDHINCTFRAKSNGAYEFIEDGKYTPVIRGETKLDAIKPRSKWEWGDIYNYAAEVIQFVWDEEEERMVSI